MNADVKQISKTNRSKRTWGLIILLFPNTLLLVAVVLSKYMDEVGQSTPDLVDAFLTFAVLFSILTWIPAAAIGIMLLVASKRQPVPGPAPAVAAPDITNPDFQPNMLIHSSAKIPNVVPFRVLSIFTAAFVSGSLPFGIFMLAILRDPDESEAGLYAFMYGLVCVSLLLTLFTCIVAMIMAFPVIRNGFAKVVFFSSLLTSIVLLFFAGMFVMDMTIRSGDFLLTALTLALNPLYMVIMLSLVLSSVFSFKLKDMH
jgi:hypothetical protein